MRAGLAPAGVRGDHFVLVGCGGVWVGTWRWDVRSDELGSTPTTGTVESDDDPEVPPRPCCPSGVGVAPAAGGGAGLPRSGKPGMLIGAAPDSPATSMTSATTITTAIDEPIMTAIRRRRPE